MMRGGGKLKSEHSLERCGKNEQTVEKVFTPFRGVTVKITTLGKLGQEGH